MNPFMSDFNPELLSQSLVFIEFMGPYITIIIIIIIITAITKGMIITAIIVIVIIIIFEGNSREVGQNLSVLRTRVGHISSSGISASKLQKWFSKDFFSKSFISSSKQVTDEIFKGFTLISTSLNIPCSGFLHVKHCSSLLNQLRASAT